MPLPEEVAPPGPIPEPPAQTVSQAVLDEGKILFTKACGECHWNMNGGYPDLRRMSPEVHAAFRDIVLRGERAAPGMANFSDILTEKQVDFIHSYLISLSRDAWQEQQKSGK